jgi:osmotically-inducible protein OsmY
MAEPQAPAVRPDVDIREEIGAIIVRYPPLSAERRSFDVSAKGGVVRFTGYLSTRIHYRYLIEHTRQVRGVEAIDDSRLYISEDLRLTIGRLLPEGVQATVRGGTVVLIGSPHDGAIDALAQRVAHVPGVERVLV